MGVMTGRVCHAKTISATLIVAFRWRRRAVRASHPAAIAPPILREMPRTENVPWRSEGGAAAEGQLAAAAPAAAAAAAFTTPVK